MPIIELELCSILDYVGSRTRPLKEGEAVFKAGHIIACGVEESNNKKIRSLCLQSSALVEHPHEINILLADEGWKCQCSCKAGLSGFCKHIIATLIYVNRHENLEELGCTDFTQKWGKEKASVRELYCPKPFRQFCHPEIKKKFEFQTCKEVDEKNFNLLYLGASNSELSRFKDRSVSTINCGILDEACTSQTQSTETKNTSFGIGKDERAQLEHYLKILFGNIAQSRFLENIKGAVDFESYELNKCCQKILEELNEANILEIASSYSQGSDQWKKERQVRITGSTCYSIYTYGRNVDVDWENKSIKYFFPKGFKNKYTEHGLKHEKDAIEVFRTQSDFEVVTPSLIVSQCFPWLGFSADGILFHEQVPSALLEIKCPYIGKDHGHDDAKFFEACNFLEVNDDNISLKKRHMYYGQVQLGMALLNLPTTYFIVYSSFSKNYIEIKVDFDEMFASDMIKNVTDKYFKKMLHHYCLNK